MSVNLDLQIACNNTDLPNLASFQRWAEVALQGRRLRSELCIRVVSAEESQELNRTWRDKDSATNVLSFPFEAPPGIPCELIGDLVICADVVTQEAEAQQKPVDAHWAHMVIHGILHLIGFDHINEAEAEEMEAVEIALLAQLGYANPYLSA